VQAIRRGRGAERGRLYKPSPELVVRMSTAPPSSKAITVETRLREDSSDVGKRLTAKIWKPASKSALHLKGD
jgi:hypothetical protein